MCVLSTYLKHRKRLTLNHCGGSAANSKRKSLVAPLLTI